MTKDFWRVLFIALLCKSAVAAAAEPSMPQAFLAKLPDAVDGIPQLNSQGGVATYDLGANYKSGEDVISLYIFRATNPNAALWFERADSLINFIWKPKGLGEGEPIESFSVPGAQQPSGLRRAYRLGNGSTALAVAEVNGWLLKIRSTSDRLSPAEQIGRLDRIMKDLAVPPSLAPPHPLVLPPECAEADPNASIEALVGAEAIRQPKGEDILAAGMTALAHADSVIGGKGSLAEEPTKYCRMKLPENLAPYGTAYRNIDPAKKGWTLLFADSGRSISGLETIVFESGKAQPGGMVTANLLDRTTTAMILKGIPLVDAAVPAVTPLILRGGPDGYNSVVYGTHTVHVRDLGDKAPE